MSHTDSLATEKEMYEVLQAYRAAVDETQSQKQADKLSQLVLPFIRMRARSCMRNGGRGRDFCEPNDLAHAVWVKLFSRHPILQGTVDDSQYSNIQAYLSTVVENEHIDDLRRKAGRNKLVPRVYLHDDENPLDNLPSNRRTPSAYFALRQTSAIVERYMRQLPGKVVEVPKKLKDGTEGIKKVTLTSNHVKLIRVWLMGEGEHAWGEIAQSMSRPLSVVKRWFSEVAKHLLSDPDPDAKYLRSMYRISPETIPVLDESEDADDVVQ